ncbi:MAG: organic solvent tolerance protein OstA [Bacteroidetes bacterium]|nr:MAG: organic solvent tolerance protein OstA [Bacteroidota bacterium]
MKKTLFFILFILNFNLVFSQTKIDFDSKYLFTTKNLGPDIKILTDSVVFKHENSIMFCDSALFNYETNYFDAFGNVRLIKPGKNLEDTVFLYGDTLHYSGQDKYAKVRNHVILKKDSLLLETDSLDYDLDKNIGYYYNNGITVNGEDTLKSVFGYYFADDNEFFFKKNVEVTNPRFKMFSDTLKHNTQTKISYFIGPTEIISDSNYIYCENGWYDHNKNISQFNKNAYFKNNEQKLLGDSLYYNRNSGIGKAFQNVTFKDSIQNVLLKGNNGFYNENNGFFLMTDSARFIQVAENDSLFMHADTLQSYKDSVIVNDTAHVFRIILAFHHVKTYKSDFQSMCDSLVYNLLDSVFEMHTNPVMWSDSNQLTADYIEIQTYKNEVDEIDMIQNAFIISQSDSVRFNQIFGDEMTAYIDDKKVSEVDVKGNGKSVYFIRDDDNKLIGVNFIDCKNMDIYLKDNKLDKIWFYEKPKGKIHPPLTLTQSETTLSGFKWEEQNRPLKKEDIFIWKEAQKQQLNETSSENENTAKEDLKNEEIKDPNKK